MPAGTVIAFGNASVELDADVVINDTTATGQATTETTPASDISSTSFTVNINTANNFVQATTLVTSNLWTISTPYLLNLGACVEAFGDLKSLDKKAEMIERFSELLAATSIQFQDLNNSGSQAIVQRSAYNYS